MATLRGRRTAVDPFGTTTALVTEGPFARSRNPIHVAMTAAYAGGCALVNGLAPLLLLPVALLLVRRGVIVREERYLAARFGPAYRDYARRVRRWL